MDSLRNIEPLMKLRNAAIENLKMENFAGFVFRITSRPALQETDRLLDLRVAFLDDRLLPRRRNGIYRQFSEIHPVKYFPQCSCSFR